MLILRRNLWMLNALAFAMDLASATEMKNYSISTSAPLTDEARATAVPASDSNYYGELLSDAWLEGADIFRMLWHHCYEKVLEARMKGDDVNQYSPVISRCLKRKTLRALDRSLNADVLPLSEGINLVRYDMVDREGNLVRNPHNQTMNSTWSENNLENTDWGTLALQRFSNVLQTHVIKLDVDGTDYAANTPQKTEFRHRRRHHMMTMMMFGILSMGMVLVPMGFQFLAVLGGKALLLAKMALILSSVQGLKKVDDWNRIAYHKEKVAASPVNYGFYHSIPPYADHYEKRSYGSAGDWPKSGPVSHPHPRFEPSAPHHEPHDRYEHIKYKFDTEARTWKPEIPRAIKRSLYSLIEPKVYPVYSSSSGPEISHKNIDSLGSASHFSPSFGQLVTPIGPTTAITGVGPTEVHAEYTIDLPVNKIHLQSAIV